MDKGDGLHDATEAAESSGEIVGSDEGRAPVVGSDGERLQRHLRELELGDETASLLRDRQTLIPRVSTEQSIFEQKYEELRQRVAQLERELEQAKRERDKNAFATNFHYSDNMDQILEKIDSFGI